MNREDTLRLMAVMKAAFPDYYKHMTRNEGAAVVALWSEMLKGYSTEACNRAVKKLILESPYPPKISDVVREVRESAQPRIGGGSWAMTDWERRSFEEQQAWYERHEAELHSQGKLTAVECKARGISFEGYCAQFQEGDKAWAMTTGEGSGSWQSG